MPELSTSTPRPRIEIVDQSAAYGVTQLDLLRDATPVSRLSIIPLTLTIGVARVRVDGIGGVWTDERQRKQGYARQVMEAGLACMLDAANTEARLAGQLNPAHLSILWGIANFYEKFGYTPAAPDALVYLTDLPTSDPVPDGWTVRACEPRDVAAIQALYARSIAQAVGAVVRSPDGRVWSMLAAVAHNPTRDECRVVVSPDSVTLAEEHAIAQRSGGTTRLELSQQTLAQLAVGTFAPGDVLDRLARPPDNLARAWVENMFPQRQPYTHVFDWI